MNDEQIAAAYKDVNQRNAESFRVALAAANDRVSALEAALARADAQRIALGAQVAALEIAVGAMQARVYSGGRTA